MPPPPRVQLRFTKPKKNSKITLQRKPVPKRVDTKLVIRCGILVNLIRGHIKHVCVVRLFPGALIILNSNRVRAVSKWKPNGSGGFYKDFQFVQNKEMFRIVLYSPIPRQRATFREVTLLLL